MAETRSFVCVVCPRGCALEVELAPPAAPGLPPSAARVRGNECRRGEEYARREVVDPRRSLTSTVRTADPAFPRLPVRSSGDIPLARLREAARALDGLVAPADAKVGQVLARDFLGLGVDILACDDMDARRAPRPRAPGPAGSGAASAAASAAPAVAAASHNAPAGDAR